MNFLGSFCNFEVPFPLPGAKSGSPPLQEKSCRPIFYLPPAAHHRAQVCWGYSFLPKKSAPLATYLWPPRKQPGPGLLLLLPIQLSPRPPHPLTPPPSSPPFFRNFFRVIHHSPLFLPRPHPALLHSRQCGRRRGKGGRGRGSISCRAATLSTLSEKGSNAWREIRRLFIVKSIVMMHDIFRY